MAKLISKIPFMVNVERLAPSENDSACQNSWAEWRYQSLSSDCKVRFWRTVLDFSQLDFVHLQLFEQNPPLLLFFLYIPGRLPLVHVGSPLPFPVNILLLKHLTQALGSVC